MEASNPGKKPPWTPQGQLQLHQARGSSLGRSQSSLSRAHSQHRPDQSHPKPLESHRTSPAEDAWSRLTRERDDARRQNAELRRELARRDAQLGDANRRVAEMEEALETQLTALETEMQALERSGPRVSTTSSHKSGFGNVPLDLDDDDEDDGTSTTLARIPSTDSRSVHTIGSLLGLWDGVRPARPDPFTRGDTVAPAATMTPTKKTRPTSWNPGKALQSVGLKVLTPVRESPALAGPETPSPGSRPSQEPSSGNSSGRKKRLSMRSLKGWRLKRGSR